MLHEKHLIRLEADISWVLSHLNGHVKRLPLWDVREHPSLPSAAKPGYDPLYIAHTQK